MASIYYNAGEWTAVTSNSTGEYYQTVRVSTDGESVVYVQAATNYVPVDSFEDVADDSKKEEEPQESPEWFPLVERDREAKPRSLKPLQLAGSYG